MESSGYLTVLDNGTYNKFYRYLSLVTAAGAIIDFYSTSVGAAAVFGLTSPNGFNISSTTFGLVQGLVLLGGVVGALLWGPLSDMVGRRFVFFANLIIIGIAAILSALVTNVTELLILRFIIGIGIGADFPPALALLVEFAPVKKRGKLLMSFYVFFALGTVIAGLVGYAVYTVYGASNIEWRLLLGSIAIPAFLGILGRLNIPESPRWLARKGRWADAKKSIEEISGTSINIENMGEQPKRAFSASALKEFAKKKKNFLIVGLLIIGMLPAFITSSLTSFMPLILNTLGITSKGNGILVTTLALYVPFVFGALLARGITDRVGRIRHFLMGGIGLTISGIILVLANNNFYATVIGLIIGGVSNLMWISVTYSWASELFPTRLRGTGEGFVMTGNRALAFSGIYLTPFVKSAVNFSGLVIIFTSLALIGTVIAAIGLRNIGNVENKSLEDIEKEEGYTT